MFRASFSFIMAELMGCSHYGLITERSRGHRITQNYAIVFVNHVPCEMCVEQPEMPCKYKPHAQC